MNHFYAMWDTYRRTRVVPLLLASAILGSLFALLVVVGITLLSKGDPIFNAFGALSMLFAMGVGVAWWPIVRDIRVSSIDNKGLAIWLGVILLGACYIKYGPGGQHLGAVVSSAPIYILQIVGFEF